MKGKLLLLLSCFIVSISLIGCVENMTDTQKGAAVGAAAGVVGGQIIGGNTKSTLIGAGAGALGGALINDAIGQSKKK
ncbi:MAG: osmotically inducible lipoprotein OsmB [Desulforhopalus sp.]|jgi:osmotically inducible lipoprotein OsmB